jgi:hypothetical protein
MRLPWDAGPELRAVGAVNQRTPFPAPEPSKQQARGSSSRSDVECQAITALYSFCRAPTVLRCRKASDAATIRWHETCGVGVRSVDDRRRSFKFACRDCEQSARTLSLCSKQMLEVC